MAQIRSKQISDFLSTITWSNITSSNNVTIANAWDIKQGFDLVDDSVDSLEAYISAEVVSLEAIDAGLASDIATEKGRVDAILASADADKDSFAEIVSLINAVDTESDDAFAAYVLKANASIDSLEVADTSLETAIADEIRRATSEEARIEGKLDVEVTRAQSEETRIEAKLDTEISTTNGEVNGLIASVNSLELIDSGLATDLANEITRATSEEARIEGKLDTEIAATNGEVTGINASIDSLEIVDADIIAKLSANDTDNANLTASVNSLEVVDAGLASDIATEAGRIDAILLSADADKDSFAEIVSLINAVDTTNDNLFASYVLSNDASVDSLEVALSNEIAATNGEVTGINASIDSLEGDVSSIDTRLGSVSGDLVSSVDSLEVALSNEIAATDIEVSELKASVQSLETVDGSLETKIDGEITRAGSVETVLSDALAAEITRAGSVETVLSDALAAEITATNGDVTELEASIDSLEIQVASGATYERQNAVFVSRNVFNVAVPVLFGANDDLAVYVNGVFVDFLSPDGITFDFTGLLAYDVDVNDKVQVMGVRA
jgi:cytoskeletal protein CcmA (bactofilin family)